MNTETPPPRLVPDRPSDAAIAQAFRELRNPSGFWIYPSSASELVSQIRNRAAAIDAAAPPAEAPAERGDIPTEADALALELVSVTEERDFLRRQLAAATAAPATDTAAIAMLKRIRDWGFSGRTWSAMRAPTMEDVEACIAAHVTAPRVTGGREDLRGVLADLLDHVDAETCTHEETHRGGAIWTICDNCGRKWADDEGGFVPHEDAPAVANARAALQAATGGADHG